MMQPIQQQQCASSSAAGGTHAACSARAAAPRPRTRRRGLARAAALPDRSSSSSSSPGQQQREAEAAASSGVRGLAQRAGAALAACAVSAAALLAPPAFDGAPLPLPLAPAPAEARARLSPEEQLTVDVFKRSVPGVVNVTNLAVRRDAFTMNMLEIPQGAGSGFIWDNKGHVVTNYHVIQDASDIQVTALGGEEYSARVIGVDRDKDIAVLQITGKPGRDDSDGGRSGNTPGPRPTARRTISAVAPPTSDDGGGAGPPPPPPEALALKPLALCTSSADLVVGQKVFAIGNPFGLDHTLTTGVISGTGREIQSISGRPIQDVIQTDAAINPGNSGGPLLDSSGCLIGINTAIYSPSGANSGVGFAIPVDVVKSSVNQIIDTGRVVRPVLGISFAPDQSTEQLGVKGILVLNAREGGPAWRAGIRGTSRDDYGRLVLGDIITSINGTRVRNSSDLYRVLDKARVGQELDIEVLRGDNQEHLMATLEANTG